jgi:PDZ domain-containing secreted protein
VGGIGALVQKAVAVRESGVTLFLVPAEQTDEEIAQAQKAAGKSVKIVAVSDLEEALQALLQNGGDPLTLKK